MPGHFLLKKAPFFNVAHDGMSGPFFYLDSFSAFVISVTVSIFLEVYVRHFQQIMAVIIHVDWTLIVLPIVSVIAVVLALLVIWLCRSKYDIQRSPDGHSSYRILNL